MSGSMKGGNGDRTEQFLIAAEKAMTAMQNRFGAVNSMQGELKTFREEILTELKNLDSSCKALAESIRRLETGHAGLSKQLNSLFERLPEQVRRIEANLNDYNNNLKSLTEHSGNLSTTVDKGLQVHAFWKYISAGAIVFLLAIVGMGSYEIYQINDKFENMQAQMSGLKSSTESEKKAEEAKPPVGAKQQGKPSGPGRQR